MPLSGTMDTMQLCDLLQWIHTSAKSGTLTVSVGLDETYLAFRDGVLVALGSDDPIRLDIGQVLISKRLASADQITEAMRETDKERSLADQLIATGLVEEKVIVEVQADHAFETVLDLFFHDEGSFHFSPGEAAHRLLPPPELSRSSHLKQPIGLHELLFEGMKRLDEWHRIREVFPNSYVVVHAMDGESESPVWRELKQLDQPLSVGDLCLRFGGNRFNVYRQLYETYNQGLLGLDLMPTGKAGQAHLGPVDMLLENVRLLLGEDQFDEARAVLTTAVNLDPDNPEARALMQKVREKQLEHLYLQIPPHKTPRLMVEREKLGQYELSPRETFLASRLSGKWDVATLVVVTPLGEMETLRCLRKFLHAGLIRLEE
jgi:hypothetical protein